MCAAEGSGKTTVEHYKNIGSAFEIEELHTFTQEIIQDEIGGRSIDGDLWHWANREKSRTHFFL